MELLEKLLPPLVVALFMFVMNRNQKKRDDLLANEQKQKEKKEAEEKEAQKKKEELHIKQHQFQAKGMLLLIDSNDLALKSLKKLKDESGKALLNGELTAINKKVTEFKDEFETFIIEE